MVNGTWGDWSPERTFDVEPVNTDCQPTLPDLTISASLLGSYTSGQTGVQIPVTVNRTGGNLTNGTYVLARLYWSTNSTWDSGDTQLWESNGSIPDFSNTYLNSSGSKTVNATINIPSVSQGTYYIIAVVDPTNYQSESNENNNVAVYAVSITQSSQFTLTVSVSPSSGGTVTGAGIYTYGTQVTLTATPCSGYSFSSWSGDASGGNSVYTLIMDRNKNVTANFTAAQPPPVTLPDLTISASVLGSYTSGQTGVQIPVTVNRTGGNLTNGTYVLARLYWSTNSTWDSGDTQLWESNGSIPDFSNTYLNSSGSKTVNATINIPSVSQGTYYIIAVVDPTNYQSESNENNNVAVYAVSIGSPVVLPDLKIDGGISSSKQQGAGTFSFTGTGYTANGRGTRHFKLPNGTEDPTQTITANGTGNISWTWSPTCSSTVTTYTIWAVDNTTGRTSNNVTEIITANPSCGPLTLPVGTSPSWITFDGANIWVVNSGSNNVTKLRASDGATLGTFSVGFWEEGIAFDGANIWVANTSSNSVTKLRASDGATLGTFSVGSYPSGVAFDGANIWVTNSGSNTVSKL